MHGAEVALLADWSRGFKRAHTIVVRDSAHQEIQGWITDTPRAWHAG